MNLEYKTENIMDVKKCLIITQNYIVLMLLLPKHSNRGLTKFILYFILYYREKQFHYLHLKELHEGK